MTSRERLLKTLKREKVDRVPISLYEFDGWYDSWIRDWPEYVEILDYAKGKTDKMYLCPISDPESNKSILFYGEVEKEIISRTNWEEKASKYEKTIIHTPDGDITSLNRKDEGIHTTWTLEHLCKNEEDAKKVLSLPYIPWQPSVNSFFELEKKLNDTGIAIGDIPNAIGLTVGFFGLSKFLEMYIDNKKIIFELMDFSQERIFNYLKNVLEKGAITIYRICGPEYATPPYLSPKDFDLLVTDYDKELIKLLHKYGAQARLHSHGKIKKVLNSFLKMEIDATDPIEPPPDGDVELKEAREILGDKVILVGNIEERLFEIGKKEEIEIAVKKAIEEGAAGGPFILCPTAMPITTPLDKKIQGNIIHYIDCGIKWGKI